MKKVAIVGASGYAGGQLCRLLSRHPHVSLDSLYVSETSADKDRKISDLYGELLGICDLPLKPLKDSASIIDSGVDAVFLATDHKVSHDLAYDLINNNIVVFDLSGAFRLSDTEVFKNYYGFEHKYPELLKSAVYALPEYTRLDVLRNTKLLSLPGCYPTASQLGLKPLIEANLLDTNYRPVIDAVSGVSGAGRKAKITNSFCEVSLNAYGVFTHRHEPEIAEHLGTKIIFTPHLGNFKRGIHATITCKVKDGVSSEDVFNVYEKAYANKSLVRFKRSLPRLSDVVNTSFCDISLSYKDGYVIICSCIDNLLKGASGQAVQVFNLYYGFDETLSLI